MCEELWSMLYGNSMKDIRRKAKRKKIGQKEKWKAAMIRLANIFVFLCYSALWPFYGLSPRCHTPQQLVPDGSRDQAAGITQLWKAFSMCGWMDGWSCVYCTIFRVLFSKWDYRQHKRARQPLAYGCYSWLLHGKNQKQYGLCPFWLVIPQIKSLLFSKASILFPSHNTTQQSKKNLQGEKLQSIVAILKYSIFNKKVWDSKK